MAGDNKRCSRCAQAVNAGAHFCGFCGQAFDVLPVGPQPLINRVAGRDPIRNIAIGVVGLLFGLIWLSAEFRGQTSLPPVGHVPDTAFDAREHWQYANYVDELRGRPIQQATLRSDNRVQLQFPYHDTGLTITVRQHPQFGLDVIFQADDGQIICSAYNCSAAISFDGHAQRLPLNEPADMSAKIRFARNASSILRGLQGARRTIVELTFYKEGSQQFRFNTVGLHWPPPRSGR